MCLYQGDEGDPGDPFRVGGIYNGYGIRMEALVRDVTAELAQRGVQVVAMVDRLYAPGSSPVSAPLVLTGGSTTSPPSRARREAPRGEPIR